MWNYFEIVVGIVIILVIVNLLFRGRLCQILFHVRKFVRPQENTLPLPPYFIVQVLEFRRRHN